jgi:hypothetical protein
MNPKTLCKLGRCSTTELHPQPVKELWLHGTHVDNPGSFPTSESS